MKILFYYILLFVFSLKFCFAQNTTDFKYLQVQEEGLHIENVNYLLAKEKGLNATDFLPTPYNENGEVDYTKYIQMAIDSRDTVILPNFPILISVPGLQLKNNSYLVFQENSSLKQLETSLTQYELIGVNNVKNITIINPRLIGDRENHIGVKGEWGMGISIRSSENINIYNPHISNCWGDGIYIGRNKLSNASRNINIIGGHLDFNRRNGISIISGENVSIKKIAISNSYGTMPMAGIDIEPNLKDEILDKIVLEDVKTYNNFSEGIKVVFANLFGDKNNIKITIENHYDFGSKRALTLVGLRPEHRNGKMDLSGNLSILNPTWENNQILIEFQKDMDLPIDVSVKGGRVIKKGKSTKLKKKKSKDMSKYLTIS